MRAAKVKDRPKSSPLWSDILDHFIATANTSRLNDTDWRLFYEFVRRNKARISTVDLERRLINSGFSTEYAREIICTYELIRVFIRPQTPALIYTLYDIKRRNREKRTGPLRGGSIIDRIIEEKLKGG
jgi:hypothetical protein